MPVAITSRSASHGLDVIIRWAAALPARAALGWSLGLYAAIALADWATGVDMSFNGLYTLPICLAAWTLGTLRGLLIGLLYAVTTLSLNGFGDGYSISATHVPALVALWNALMRGFWVVCIVLLVAGFRRSYDQQLRRARTDDLTGALTKHAFRDHLGRVVASSARRSVALVLVYSDLDGFKGINDQYGHAAGDEVLVRFAEAASGAIRSRDVLARVGGDEFVMLLTVSGAEEGYRAAERLHREVGAGLAATSYPVTASMGAVVVERPAAGDEAAFLRRADELMYEVKRSGRNALRIAQVDRVEGQKLAWQAAA